MNTGSCLCGKVTYQIEGALGEVRYCYCETCRKLSGSAFSAVAKISQQHFTLLTGWEALSRYESSPGKFRYFCSCCASPIYVTVRDEPDLVRVRLGGLDFEPETTITAHMWVSEKPDWHVINDSLPQFLGPCGDDKPEQ